MTIPFRHKLIQFNGNARIDSPLLNNDKEWMAWWYVGLVKNKKAESQPNVLVGFRELINGAVSGKVAYANIQVTMLGQVRIGSVWKRGVCIKQVDFETRVFNVNFTQNSWQLNSFKAANTNRKDLPFDQSIYPLEYQNNDKTSLLEFPIKTGGKLVIPGIEFFARCYGCSSELKRVLVTYPWQGQESHESRLYATLDEDEIDDGSVWKVKLKQRLYNGDVVFLAHAKYDLYTEKVAKEIYSQIEIKYEPSRPNSPIPIEVAPWFQGPAQLKVKGIWFNNNKSFLALNVMGGSEPGGILIERDRTNTNKTNVPADAANAGKAWNGAPVKITTSPQIIDLTGNAEPDHGAATIEIQDVDYEILGITREIKDVVRDKAKSSRGVLTNGSEATSFATGNPHGTGKGIGYASIHAKAVMESEGMLMDMWTAMLYFKDKYPHQITSVEWFTFEDGYKTGELPKLIGLHPFDGDTDKLSGQVIRWPYASSDLKIPRGILVARMNFSGKFVHIIEIQRRRKAVEDDEGNITDRENFMGLIFIANSQADVVANVEYFMDAVRKVKGVVKNVLGKILGTKDIFQHSSSKEQEVVCEAAVVNALGKVGITLGP